MRPRDIGDEEATITMTKELRRIEYWLARAEDSTSDDYARACELSIELRKRLGLPQREE